MAEQPGNRPTRVRGDDLSVVVGQLGRPAHPMSRVMRRCPFGLPAVVENLPYGQAGAPFPTLYYATCPTLVVAVARVESEGGLLRLQRRLQREPELRASLAAAEAYTHARRRRLARSSGFPAADAGASLSIGLGGVREGGLRKCLHIHAAHALARPGYALGDAVLEEAGQLWCDDARCRSLLASASDATPGSDS